MARPAPEQDLSEIEAIVRHQAGGPGGGITALEIAAALAAPPPLRTLQYRLQQLVAQGRLAKEGERRWTRYRLPVASPETAYGDAAAVVPPGFAEEGGEGPPLSTAGAEIRAYLGRPMRARKPVGYDRDFLESYRPNVSAYLSDAERAHLAAIGTPPLAPQPAGTFARQILDRLLIDLSWSSSRLEGNTYSLLDTRRLVEFGEAAAGHDRLEAQMILNHKEAIEFLVGEAEGIGFDRMTLLNLHALLTSNLLHSEAAAGRIRKIAVGIGGSVYMPLEAQPVIEECFDQILYSAEAIADPFEQAFFVLVQIPYLQPFEDVNKRVSRLAANIPLIRRNLIPLTFTDVPRAAYNEAVLGVYEMKRTDLLKELFLWAYERSAERYRVVRQTIGEPDPFRMRHREALRDVIGGIVREALGRREAFARIAASAQETMPGPEREPFREMAENDLLALHEGNFARYRVTPAEFRAWWAGW